MKYLARAAIPSAVYVLRFEETLRTEQGRPFPDGPADNNGAVDDWAAFIPDANSATCPVGPVLGRGAATRGLGLGLAALYRIGVC